MVKPIESLLIVPHPVGSELNLDWALPTLLPNEYHLILFKKPAEDITPEEIASYFALWSEIYDLKKQENPDADSIQIKEDELKKALKEKSIYVARFLTAPTSFTDMLCANGRKYYYKIFLQDIVTREYSEPVSGNAIPKITAKIVLVDAKSLTRRAVRRIVDGLENENSPQQLKINVQKEFSRLEGVDQWITVNRAAAETEQRFFGNQLYKWNDYSATGFIEKEVIQITWFSRNNPDFLDAMTKLFRAQIEALNRYFLHNNIIEALFTMIPDGVDERDPDAKTLYSGMLIAILSETRTIKQEYSAPVEFNFENLNVTSEHENETTIIEYQ